MMIQTTIKLKQNLTNPLFPTILAMSNAFYLNLSHARLFDSWISILLECLVMELAISA
jgi:hypothetical protein